MLLAIGFMGCSAGSSGTATPDDVFHGGVAVSATLPATIHLDEGERIEVGGIPDFGTSVVWHEAFSRAGCHDVELGDVDGDGDLDLVVVRDMLGQNAQAQTVWYRNERDASAFVSRGVIPTGGSPGIALGDVDLDGRLDVLSAFAGGDAALMRFSHDGKGDNWTEHVVAPLRDGQYPAAFDSFAIHCAPSQGNLPLTVAIATNEERLRLLTHGADGGFSMISAAGAFQSASGAPPIGLAMRDAQHYVQISDQGVLPWEVQDGKLRAQALWAPAARYSSVAACRSGVLVSWTQVLQGQQRCRVGLVRQQGDSSWEWETGTLDGWNGVEREAAACGSIRRHAAPDIVVGKQRDLHLFAEGSLARHAAIWTLPGAVPGPATGMQLDPERITAVALGDLDGDADDDIVVGTSRGLYVLHNLDTLNVTGLYGAADDGGTVLVTPRLLDVQGGDLVSVAGVREYDGEHKVVKSWWAGRGHVQIATPWKPEIWGAPYVESMEATRVRACPLTPSSAATRDPDAELVGAYSLDGRTILQTRVDLELVVGDTLALRGTGLMDGRWIVRASFRAQGRYCYGIDRALGTFSLTSACRVQALVADEPPG